MWIFAIVFAVFWNYGWLPALLMLVGLVLFDRVIDKMNGE